MPQIANIVSEKYYNQFKNGTSFGSSLSDFSPNLSGNVGEKIKAVIQISIGWNSNSDSFNVWQVYGNQIKRFSGSFLEDGFVSGHKFSYISSWSIDNEAPIEFNGTITSISNDGLELNFTVEAGSVPIGTQNDAGIWARAEEPACQLTALVYRFGLLDNNADFSNVSNVSGNSCAFVASGIDRLSTVVNMSHQGTYRDWQSGSATVKFIGDTPTFQTFEITHEFIITPFYLEGQLNNLQNTVLPDYLEGENTLKYAYQAEFRLVLSNPNTAIAATIDQNRGSVGWFGENFNGLPSDYSIDSISYTDTLTAAPVASLQSKQKTSVLIEVDKLSGAFSAGQQARIFIAYLATQSQYQNKTTDIQENFLYESLSNAEGNAPVNGSIISNLELSLLAGNLVATFDIEYLPSQQAYIGEGAYLIAIQVGNSAISSINSDRVILLADAKEFITAQNIAGLHAFTKFNIHFADSEIGIDDGYTEFSGFNEDSLAVDFEFWLDTDVSKKAYLNSLQFALIAYNTVTGEWFDLDRFDLPISSSTTQVGNIQKIEIASQRAYLFENGNQYREIQITTGSLIGTKQYYTGVYSQKIRWEDWIKNLSANTDFYNSSEPNNNLNFKSSNYSDLLDYEIRLQALANVSGLDNSGQISETVYNTISNNISVGGYGNNTEFTAEIELFDETGANNTGGIALIGESMLVRATFTAIIGAISDLADYKAIIRLQSLNDSGQQIYEISTFYSGFGDKLVPKSGFNFVDLYIDSGNAVAECLLKNIEGEFILSARLIAPPQIIGFVQFMNDDFAQFMNGDFAKFLNQ